MAEADLFSKSTTSKDLDEKTKMIKQNNTDLEIAVLGARRVDDGAAPRPGKVLSVVAAGRASRSSPGSVLTLPGRYVVQSRYVTHSPARPARQAGRRPANSHREGLD